MENPEMMKKLYDLNASVNRMWTIFTRVVDTTKTDEIAGYIEEKERVSNLLAELSGDPVCSSSLLTVSQWDERQWYHLAALFRVHREEAIARICEDRALHIVHAREETYFPVGK